MATMFCSAIWYQRSPMRRIIPKRTIMSVWHTVYPKKYAHGFVVLCFVVVMQSFIMNSQEVFIHIHQGCFAGIGAIVRLPQCQWSKPDGYGKISQCITTTKHSKAKTVCIFLGIYCMKPFSLNVAKCQDTYHICFDDHVWYPVPDHGNMITKWMLLNWMNEWIGIFFALKLSHVISQSVLKKFEEIISRC